MERRKWVPDPGVIAYQLIEDYRNAPADEYDEDNAFNAALNTLTTEIGRAKLEGDEFQEDDWVALVMELARRAAGLDV